MAFVQCFAELIKKNVYNLRATYSIWLDIFIVLLPLKTIRWMLAAIWIFIPHEFEGISYFAEERGPLHFFGEKVIV